MNADGKIHPTGSFRKSKNKFKKGVLRESPKVLSNSKVENKKKMHDVGNHHSAETGLDDSAGQMKKSKKKISKIFGSTLSFAEKFDTMSKKKGKKKKMEELNTLSVEGNENNSAGSAQLLKKKKKRKTGFKNDYETAQKITGGFDAEMEDELEQSMESKALKSETVEERNEGTDHVIPKKKKKNNKNKYRVSQESSETVSVEPSATDLKSNSKMEKKKTASHGESCMSKFSHLSKKRKMADDSSDLENSGKQWKRKKQGNTEPASKPLKFSKQAKKIRKELPGLEEPELTKYRSFPDSSALDNDEKSSDESFDDESEESSSDEEGESLLTTLRRDSPEKLERTVFVGNIPMSMKTSSLKKIFSQCGRVEAVRFRSSIPKKMSIPKKVANIKHEYSEFATSLKGYVVFEEVESVEKAISMSGTVVEGHHICVDYAVGNQQVNHKLSVFIGNLPYNVDDETLWNTFSEVGTVKNIRVIRDRETGVGKGFGFVQFQGKEAVQEAVGMSEKLEIGDRKIRIKKCAAVSKPKEIQSSEKPWKPIGKEIKVSPNAKRNQNRKFGFKKLQKNAEQDGSRKTIKKLMNKKKREQEKKKISSLFEKKTKREM